MIRGKDSSAGRGLYKTDWKSTGCYSVDMVLSAVSFYRNKKRPLKSVILSRYHYDRLDDYFKTNHIDQNASIDPNAKYTLDGVEILRAESSIVDDLYFEFWPMVRSEEDDEKYLKKGE